jgi:hypothetical protein
MQFLTVRRGARPWTVLIACWLALAASAARSGAPDEAAVEVGPPLCLERLAQMSWCELEALYRQAEPGPIPDGYAPGRAIYCPGDPLTPARTRFTKAIWHGKHFCAADGTLINQWCLGIRAVRARVDYGPSLLDGKPSIIMDYSGMSRVVWSDVRDEVREVAPGLYLGLMYRRKGPCPQMKLYFALQLTPCP